MCAAATQYPFAAASANALFLRCLAVATWHLGPLCQVSVIHEQVELGIRFGEESRGTAEVGTT